MELLMQVLEIPVAGLLAAQYIASSHANLVYPNTFNEPEPDLKIEPAADHKSYLPLGRELCEID